MPGYPPAASSDPGPADAAPRPGSQPPRGARGPDGACGGAEQPRFAEEFSGWAQLPGCLDFGDLMAAVRALPGGERGLAEPAGYVSAGEFVPAGDGARREEAALPRFLREVSASELAGAVIEDTAPGPGLAGWLEEADPAQLGDAALVRSIAAWRRQASQAAAGELAAVAELARRRPAGRRGRGGGVGDDAGEAARAVVVSREAAEEVALALTLTCCSAGTLTHLAVSLARKLPATLAALRAGAIDLARARLIYFATDVLDERQAALVEDRVLPGAGDLTTGDLRDELARAVIAVDPAAADRRREEAEKQADVNLYANPDGTAALAGQCLSPVHAAAALARITAIAQAMKAAGAKGGIRLLRSRVFIGLLLGTLPLIPPAAEDPAAPGPPGPPGSGGSGPAGPAGSSGGLGGASETGDSGGMPDDSGPASHNNVCTGDACSDEGPQEKDDAPRDDHGAGWGDEAAWQDFEPSGDGGRGDGEAGDDPEWPGLPVPGDAPAPGCAPVPPAPVPAGRLTLLVSWRTLAGTGSEPGRICWLGYLTPAMSRELAQAAAADPSCEWKVIVTGEDDRAITVTRLSRRRRLAAAAGSSAGTGGPAPPGGKGLIREVTLILPRRLLPDGGFAASAHDGSVRGHAACGDPARNGPARDGPPRYEDAPPRDGSVQGGHGGQLDAILAGALTAGAKAAARAAARVAGEAREGGCAHADATSAYRVPPRMRRFVEARDRTCRFPPCRQPSARCDADHTLAHHQGGRTCPCNLGPECRAHHVLKTLPGWHLAQPEPGTFTWTTPAGLTYTVTPDTYPG